jgi:hypothetical protein
VLGGLYLGTFIKEEIMKIQLLTSVGIKGKDIAKGEVVDVDANLAAKLILSNKAQASKAKKKSKK